MPCRRCSAGTAADALQLAKARQFPAHLQGEAWPQSEQPWCMPWRSPQGQIQSPIQLTTRTSDSSRCKGSVGGVRQWQLER